MNLRDGVGAGAQLGAACRQGAMQDDRPAHVAVQEDPHRGRQEDQEEELPLLQALRESYSRFQPSVVTFTGAKICISPLTHSPRDGAGAQRSSPRPRKLEHQMLF